MKHIKKSNSSKDAGHTLPADARRKNGGWSNLRVLFLSLFTFFAFYGLEAQCTLACIGTINSPLQVSVNQTCGVTLVIDAVVQSPTDCPGPKNMIARDDQNNIVAIGVDVISFDGGPYVGEVLSVEIEDINSDIICVGFIELMDFVNPVFDIACSDITMGCMGDTSALVVGVPEASDACGSIASLTYSDVVTLGNCLTAIVTHVERTWIATDNSGNSVSCVQMIYLEKPSLDMVVFPDDITLSCDDPDADPETVTGVPMIDGGSIMNGDICNFLTTFEDDTLAVCSTIEYQIIRTFTVIDNCSDFLITDQQIITISDESNPVIVCPDNLLVPAVAGECYGTVFLPTPEASDNCDADPDIFVLTSYGEVDFGPHTNVPMGTQTVTYTAVDECGNTTTCSITVNVIDDQIPTAVCNDELIVSISSGGIGVVNAISFDEGSSDNCINQLYYKVRRVVTGVCDNANGDDSDSVPGYQEWYDDQVYFCCEEMEEESIMVMLHVYEVDPGPGPVDPARELPGGDLFDHFNECLTDVTVQDQIAPVFVFCPADVTIDCHDDYEDLSIFGSPVAVDNCTYVIDSVEVESIDDCGIGNIVRTFTVTDLVGHTAICVQEITLINEEPFTEDQITWPPTYTTYECGASVNPEDLPEEYQLPVFSGDQCSNLVYNYTDALYTITLPACYKILRKWTVIDWCNFDEENPNAGGKFTHTQVIKVLDQDDPVIETCPENVTVAVDADCNSATVTLESVVAEDCSNGMVITNNSPYAYANGNNASGVYPLGTTLITFTVADLCGNASQCEVLITVEDQTGPGIICITGLSVDLVEDGDIPTAGVGVNAFINGTFDNCTDVADITKTLRIGNGFNTIPPTDTNLVFSCAEEGIQEIEVWVTDEQGNSEFCLTYIDVQDNLNICPNQSTNNVNMIAGTIVTPIGEHIEEVMVNVDGGSEDEAMTGDDGHFEFPEVPAGEDYTLIPEKTEDILNGVSTMDLILITKHILGVQPFSSPYKYLASDVNNSQSITTTDLIKLRKLVLQIDDQLPAGTNSWRFVDANFEFPDPANPWATEIPGLLNLDNLDGDVMAADFVGIKIGDVNDTATPNSLIGTEERSAYAEFGIAVENRAIEEGETVTIDFIARDMDKLAGFQFTLSFDPEALEFLDASSADLPAMDVNNFGTSAIDYGMLTSSWNQMGEKPASDEIVLFSLTFNSNANAELQDMIFIDSRMTEAEAYTVDEDLLDLGLVFLTSASTNIDGGNELYQNRPNPFSDDTIIPFKLSEAGEVSMNVYDLAGRLIYHLEGEFESGYNEIVIGKEDLSVTGVMYYELRAGGWKDTRKMILTE
jgi:hypothetical protein